MQANTLSQDAAPGRADDYKRLSALAAAVLTLASHQIVQAAPLVVQPGSNASYTFIPAPVGGAPSPTPTPPPPPSPAACTASAAAAVTWSSGASSCVGDSQTVAAGTSVASGSSVTYTDNVAPVTGTNTLTCTNGTWGSTSSSCTTAAPPPPAACTVPNYSGQSWSQGASTCNSGSQSHAAGASIASGSSVTLTDATAPTTGSAAMLCTNGSFSTSSALCSTAAPPPPAACTVPNKVGATWTSGASTCTGGTQTATAGSSIVSGSSYTVNDSTAPTTGSETYLCTNGAFSITGTNCTTAAPPPPASCTVTNLNGTTFYGAATCTINSQNVGAGSILGHGGSLTASDTTGPSTGSVTYNCNNGVLTQGTATCTQPANCTVPNGVGSASWTSSGTCVATSQSVTAGTSVVSGSTFIYYDNTAPTTGTRTMQCNNGSFNSQSLSCTTEAVSTTFSWLTGTYTGGALTVNYSSGTTYTVGFTAQENVWTSTYIGGGHTTKEGATGGKTWTAGTPSIGSQSSAVVCVGKANYGSAPISSYVYAYSGGNCNLTSIAGVGGWVSQATYSAYLALATVYNNLDRHTVNSSMSVSQSSPSSASFNSSFTTTRNGSYLGTGTVTVSFAKSGSKAIANATVTRMNGTSFSNTLYN